MTILTDQEKQDIAETVVHMSFDINYAESIAHVCELAEAEVIRKLATVSVEPPYLCKSTRFKMSFFQNEDGQGGYTDGTHVTCFEAFEDELDGKWVALVPAEDDRHVSDFQAALAAVRVQAIEEAAKICECQWSTLEERDAGIEFAEAIRALIGGKDEPRPNH